jgi:hypothetical protein
MHMRVVHAGLRCWCWLWLGRNGSPVGTSSDEPQSNPWPRHRRRSVSEKDRRRGGAPIDPSLLHAGRTSRGRPAGAGAMCVAAMHAHLHVGRAYGFDRVMGYGCSDRSSSVPAGRRHRSIVSLASQPASIHRLARHLTAAAGHSHLPSRGAYTGPRTSSRAKLRVRT